MGAEDDMGAEEADRRPAGRPRPARSRQSRLDLLTRGVVPALRRAGLFRHDYEGPTPKHHLGIARPGRCFPARTRGGE